MRRLRESYFEDLPPAVKKVLEQELIDLAFASSSITVLEECRQKVVEKLRCLNKCNNGKVYDTYGIGQAMAAGIEWEEGTYTDSCDRCVDGWRPFSQS